MGGKIDLGVSWRPLGAVLEPLGSILGFLEALWTNLGPSGAVLKTFWEVCRSAEVEWSPPGTPRDSPGTHPVPPPYPPPGRLWGDNRGASPRLRHDVNAKRKRRSESETKGKRRSETKGSTPLTRRQVGGFKLNINKRRLENQIKMQNNARTHTHTHTHTRGNT